MTVSMKRLAIPLLCALMFVPPFVAVSQTVASAQTQAVAAATAPTVVPALVPYSGVALNAAGAPLSGEDSITFLIFKDETGGEPLFSETQSVTLDPTGHYKVNLGATLPSGLPADLFSTGEARWLEVQVAGQAPQSRALLASVPYAMKAADAATLGGLPASAFALAGTGVFARNATAANLSPDVTANVTTPGGKAGYVPAFTGASTIANSPIFVKGSNVGIGITDPSFPLHVVGDTVLNGGLAVIGNTFYQGPAVLTATGTATAATGYNSQPFKFIASGYNSSSKAAVSSHFLFQSEVSGNNTAAPTATLNLLASPTATPLETGFSFNTKGIITFAPGQTFPGTGAIAGVTAGTALTGGGTSGNVTLNVDTTKVPLLGTANIFVGNQSITGNLSTSGSVTTQGPGVFDAAGTSSTGLSGTGTVTGVSGQATGTTNASGVNGYASATTGQVSGVSGYTASTGASAAGVNGYEGAKTGAVFGVAGGTSSTGNGAAGVNGYEGATTGYVFGVSGTTPSAGLNASGVLGNEQASKGQVYGVTGITNSAGPFAAAVQGYEGSPTGQVYGVIGDVVSTTTNAVGVYGNVEAVTGQVFGVFGGAVSTTNGAAAINGNEGATTGQVYGVTGSAVSTTNGAAAINGYEGAATGRVYGVSGSTNSTTQGAAGVNGGEGATTGQVYGVSGNTASTGNGSAGVLGIEGAATGFVSGVYGSTNSPDGTGVVGSNNSTTGGNGVSGTSNAASGSGNGVYGSSNSPNGTGLTGVNNALSGPAIGVLGTSASVSTGATAVEGIATSTTGDNYGVVGMSNSFDGYGVFGSSAYKAVAGWSQSCSGGSCTVASGTAGEFVTGVGGTILRGSQRTADTITQVFSVDSSGDGVFAGNLTVLGKVSKGSGSFKIDDPLDPANKYLSHSFVESPDMMNVYNGNIVTDKRGVATVELPEYFDALNRDFRYQLTVMGQFAQAIVAKKIAGNRFVIRTTKPNVEVSWQVTGIRQDAYANANRIPTEEDKPANERGYYLHPEVYGQPASKGIVAAGGPKPSVKPGTQVASAAHP